jgi:hypothetical protein
MVVIVLAVVWVAVLIVGGVPSVVVVRVAVLLVGVAVLLVGGVVVVRVAVFLVRRRLRRVLRRCGAGVLDRLVRVRVRVRVRVVRISLHAFRHSFRSHSGQVVRLSRIVLSAIV